MGYNKQQAIKISEMHGGKGDLSDYIDGEEDRWGNMAIQENPNFRNFPEFIHAFKQHFSTSNSGRALLDRIQNRHFLQIFEGSGEVKQRLVENVGRAEAEQELAQARIEVSALTIPTQQVKAPSAFKTAPRIVQRGGRSYERSYSMKWDKPHVHFLKERKGRGLKPKMVVAEYRQAFPSTQRSNKSITNKYYRVKV